MAEDDYFVIVFKVLLYLYGCLKRELTFEEVVFRKSVGNINEDYLNDVLFMMQDNGYIEGLDYVNAWGNEKVLTSDYADMRITEKGIEYLTQNNIMTKVKEHLLAYQGIIASLIKLVL